MGKVHKKNKEFALANSGAFGGCLRQASYSPECPSSGRVFYRTERNLLSDKKGFTLIELVVTLVLVSVAGTFLLSLIAPMFNIYSAVSEKIEAQSMTDTVFNELLNELEFAKDFAVSDDKTELAYRLPDDAAAYTIAGETFGETVFPATEFDINITFEEEDKILVIKIKINDEDSKEITVKEITLLSPNNAL